ncbi:DUF1232 domain-containing protein [Vitreoscilla massiliensis]|uniref:DUF1232 domain-containing protein n=1 Tax=Vitreoscilla massiliensis TaxID=1689272 RepID=A0ABY4DYV4_9NEIS|nr:YkvA family protein [Vitreoscilla massiliensis]UOO88705.1 DUF1232 domain-containing protein [Vitreoscilla massiliensis]
MNSLFPRCKRWAFALKRDAVTLYLCARHKRTPALARLLAMLVAAYALSPIDLIPDFIPILGFVDDVILIPLGVWLVLRLIPAELIAEQRLRASQLLQRPRSKLAAGIIIAIWLCFGVTLMVCLFQ